MKADPRADRWIPSRGRRYFDHPNRSSDGRPTYWCAARDRSRPRGSCSL